MHSKRLFSHFVSFYVIYCFLVCGSISYELPMTVGVISEHTDNESGAVVKYALDNAKRYFWPPNLYVEVLEEKYDSNDETQLHKAVCNLLKGGVHAIFAKTNMLTYPLLSSYATEFETILFSDMFPDIPPDLVLPNGFSMQSSTTRTILDLIRNYSWQDIVYVYDEKNGPEKLQKIFQLSYRVLNINLLGLLKVYHVNEVNKYIRKLDSSDPQRNYCVILDVEPELAKDIIIQHVHDIYVKKTNFHFLIAQPTLEEFWMSSAPQFGTVNVTGFTTLSTPNVNNFLDKWNQQPADKKHGVGSKLNISSYFLYDAAVFFIEGIKKFMTPGNILHKRPEYFQLNRSESCLESCRHCRLNPMEQAILRQLANHEVMKNTVSGKIAFNSINERKDFQIEIVQVSQQIYKKVGYWSNISGLKQSYPDSSSLTKIADKLTMKRFKILSLLSPPFLMLTEMSEWKKLLLNRTHDKYRGFVKDLTDQLATDLGFVYDIVLPEDNAYGDYIESKRQWSGIMGELIGGKADIAIADMPITARRQRVVDFISVPTIAASLSILMKNPQYLSSSPTAFLLSGFSKEIWICIIILTIFVITLFHFMSNFTGSPDNIEATSGIWGKKFTAISSCWFMIGSSLMHGTGIYPRSMSCRILGGTWWCFSLILLSHFIAITTTRFFIENMDSVDSPQVARLTSLSLNSILKESVANNWPKIGIMKDGSALQHIQKSSLPLYQELATYFQNNPDLVIDDMNLGVRKVRESNGNFAFLMESTKSDYYSQSESCDLISIHDVIPHVEYGIAVPLGSPLKKQFRDAMYNLKNRGDFGYLHRKWWTDELKCDKTPSKAKVQSLVIISSIFYLAFAGIVIAGITSVIQYFWKAHKKEGRRQKLSFEEVAMDQSALPLPPPELLMENAVEEDNGVIDGWAERKLVPTSFSHESQRSSHNGE